MSKKNEYIFKKNYIIILCPTKNDETFLKVKIDINDYNLVKNYYWRIHTKKGYPCANIKKYDENKNRYIHTKIMLHNLIMGNFYNEGILIDHKDRNKLNNRRKNLRYTDIYGNNKNKSKDKRNTSGRTGVRYEKDKYGNIICVVGEFYVKGKRHRKTFSINKYGKNEAYRLAEEFRIEGEKKYNILNEK